MSNQSEWNVRLWNGVRTLSLVVLLLVVLAALWASVVLLVNLVGIGGESGRYMATAVALGVLLSTVAVSRVAEWSLTLRTATFSLLSAFGSVVFLGAVWIMFFVPALIVIGFETARTIATAITLVLASAVPLVLLPLSGLSGPATDWSLRLRMVASLLFLGVLTLGLLATIWTLFFVLFAFIFGSYALHVATLVTVGLLVGLAYREYDTVTSAEGRIDATPLTTEDAPELHALTMRIATQLDVPMPTIAFSDTHAPEALVAGYRPSSMHLVLSRGTIESLTDAELEAVIAHELAHIANRDAMVMTIVSTPVALADGFRATMIGLIANGAWGIRGRRRKRRRTRTRSSKSTTGRLRAIVALYAIKFVLLTIATVSWVASRSIVAILSRARETAADRTAVEVTGSPAKLASALSKLDDEITATPQQDLRDAASVSALSILPLEPRHVEKVTLGADGDVEPFLWSVRAPIKRAKKRLFDTHPPTERRLEELRQ